MLLVDPDEMAIRSEVPGQVPSPVADAGGIKASFAGLQYNHPVVFRLDLPAMNKVSMERVQAYYRAHRRENFAASQRLEGILIEVTQRGNKEPLPTREAVLRKYAALRR